MSVHKKYFHQKTSGHPMQIFWERDTSVKVLLYQLPCRIMSHPLGYADLDLTHNVFFGISAMLQCLDKPGTRAKCGAS